MPPRHQVLVRARALMGFPGLVAEHGGDGAALLAGAGIPPRVIDTPDATVPLDRAARLLDDAARKLRVPDFGLQLAGRQDISVLGAVALIARYAATVGDALRGIIRHFPYHTPGVRLELVADERAKDAELRYDTTVDPDVPRRQAAELSFGVIVPFLRLVTGDPGTNWHVGFRHARGMSPARYHKAFGCSVGFEEEWDRLVFPARLLQTPIDQRSVKLHEAAERFVGNVIRRFPLDVRQQVDTLIERQLAAGGCTIARIARQMGLHERTLQRRLDAQGATFEDIIDRLRRERARELLALAVIPLNQVGELLGYSEQSAFNRACLRWFGDTPRALRGRLQRSSASRHSARSFARPHAS